MYTKKNVGITNEEKAFLRSGGGGQSIRIPNKYVG